jgi:hypothetical protein
LILLRVGLSGIIMLDAASFLVSMGSVCLLTSPVSQPTKDVLSSEEFEKSQRVLAGTNASMRIEKGKDVRRRISGVFIPGALIMYTAGTLSILLPIFVRTMLFAGPLTYGWLLTAQAIGEGTMSALVGQSFMRRGMVPGCISGCLAVGGLSLVLLVHIHMVIPGLMLNLVFGAVTAALSVQLLTLLQQRATGRVAGRALAAYAGVQVLAQVGGMGMASAMVGAMGVVNLVMFDAGLYVLGSMLVWILV